MSNTISSALWKNLNSGDNQKKITLDEWNAYHGFDTKSNQDTKNNDFVEDVINAWYKDDTDKKKNISEDEKKVTANALKNLMKDGKATKGAVNATLNKHLNEAAETSEKETSKFDSREGTDILEDKNKDGNNDRTERLWKQNVESVFDYYDRMDSGEQGKLGKAEGDITNPFFMTEQFWSRHKDWEDTDISEEDREIIKSYIDYAKQDDKLTEEEFKEIWDTIEKAADGETIYKKGKILIIKEEEKE